MHKIGLVILFNQRYTGNLEKLRLIYGNRFSVLRFLMPFYDGNDADVITVYEVPSTFQGYLYQAEDALLALDCDGFLFIGDDLLLHPAINESNDVSTLHIENALAGICETEMINRPGGFSWIHARGATSPFVMNEIQWQDILPPYTQALTIFSKYFECPYPEQFGDAFFSGRMEEETDEEWAQWVKTFLEWNGGTYDIHYPLAFGYSDIFYLHKSVYKKVSRLCAILAAMGSFVEVALPTAIVLAVKKEHVTLFTDYFDQESCHTLWSNADKTQLELDFGNSYQRLKANWPEEWLFVHPVKLSRWDVSP